MIHVIIFVTLSLLRLDDERLLFLSKRKYEPWTSSPRPGASDNNDLHLQVCQSAQETSPSPSRRRPSPSPSPSPSLSLSPSPSTSSSSSSCPRRRSWRGFLPVHRSRCPRARGPSSSPSCSPSQTPPPPCQKTIKASTVGQM